MNDYTALSLGIATGMLLPAIVLIYFSTALQRLNSAQIDRVFELEEGQDTYHGLKIANIFLGVTYAAILFEIICLIAFFTWLINRTVATSGDLVMFVIIAMIAESCARIILPAIFPIHLRDQFWKWERALLLACAFLFYVPVYLTRRLINRTTDALSPRSEDERMAQAEDTIRSIIDAGAKDGVFREDESEMLQSILEMSETIVREVMTPRIDLQAIEISSSIDDFVAKVIESGFSKIPVYQDRVDNIVGILYAKDVLQYWRNRDAGVTLDSLKRVATFVPETKRIAVLLKEFQKEKKHLAIVVDEFGGVAGLVTIEDLLEEIVGEIHDEYDQELVSIRQISENVWEAAARIDLDELGEEIDSEFPEDNYETLGGFLFHLFGRVPAPGETQTFQNLHFKVIKANDRRIETVMVTVEPEGKLHKNGHEITKSES
ncbi:HlyC/CorC family transporter [bacterium]|nr:HlyC/CorC family transporter [candidate division CSSED10-310 bacterium]